MWMLLLVGCANNIRDLYEADRAAALADPGAVGQNWTPELRIRLSDDALGELSEAAVRSGLLKAETTVEMQGPLGLTAQIKPKAAVSALRLSAASNCDACLNLDVTLEGLAGWKLGGVSGEVPLTLNLDGTVGFEVRRVDEGFSVTARVKDFKHIKVKAGMAGDLDLARVMQGWAKTISDKAPPMDVGTFGGVDLPLRALRLATVGGALSVEAVTDVAGGGPLSADATPLHDDWELQLSDTTALALMRRAAFQQGVITYDVAADPRSFALDGNEFTLGLRLWRLTPRGWWRDYEVTGLVGVNSKQLRLKPDKATAVAQSPGAGLADPMAMLAQGSILKAVEDALVQSFPSGEGTTMGSEKLRARATSVMGAHDAVIVRGSLERE